MKRNHPEAHITYPEEKEIQSKHKFLNVGEIWYVKFSNDITKSVQEIEILELTNATVKYRNQTRTEKTTRMKISDIEWIETVGETEQEYAMRNFPPDYPCA